MHPEEHYKPITPHREGLRLMCVACGIFFPIENLRADSFGGFPEYYCPTCVPSRTTTGETNV